MRYHTNFQFISFFRCIGRSTCVPETITSDVPLFVWSRWIERVERSKLIQTNLTEPDVKLFMRHTKLIESSSWKVWRLAQLSSSEWVWIVQYVLSIWTGDCLQNKCQSSHATNYTNKLKVCLFLLLIWFSWLVQCAPSSTSDPKTWFRP